MLLDNILAQLGLSTEPQHCFGTDHKLLRTLSKHVKLASDQIHDLVYTFFKSII